MKVCLPSFKWLLPFVLGVIVGSCAVTHAAYAPEFGKDYVNNGTNYLWCGYSLEGLVAYWSVERPMGNGALYMWNSPYRDFRTWWFTAGGPGFSWTQVYFSNPGTVVILR